MRQIGILAFLTGVLLLGTGTAGRIKDYENEALQEIVGELKAQESPDGTSEIIPQESAENNPAGTNDGNAKNVPILEEYQRVYETNPDFVG